MDMLESQQVYLEKHIKVHERVRDRLVKKFEKSKEFVSYGERDNERVKARFDPDWLAKQQAELQKLKHDNEIRDRTNELCKSKIESLQVLVKN